MEEIKLKTTNALKHFNQTPQIKNGYTDEERRKIAGASKDFESLLTNMMIKSMTSTTNGLFGEESYGGDFFNSIFNSELSSYMTRSNGFGIAEQIYEKVTGEKFDMSILDPKYSSKPLDNIEKTTNDKITIEQSGGHREIKPSSKSLDRVQRFDEIINKVSDQFKIDKNIIKAVILAESAGNEKAVSKANAKGLMQLMDKTASEMGVSNSFDPEENIYGGAKYLTGLLRQYNGNLELSLAAYNAGPGNVQKYSGIPPFEETNSYIKRVIGYYNYFNG